MAILDLKTFSRNYNPINEELDLDDILTSKLGHKKKIKTPEGINIKVKGQSISKEEILGFFDTVKKYLSIVPFSKLKEHDKANRGKEIRHDDLEFTYDNRGLVDNIIDRTGKKGSSIDIDYGGGRVVFKRKEGQSTDKIKLILLPKFLDNEDNSQLLDELVDDVIKKDEISTELSNEYDIDHDNQKIKGEEEREQQQEKEFKEEEKAKEEEKKANTEHEHVPEKIVTEVEVADPVTARKICDVLLSQRLYVSTADTDETALFDLLAGGETPLLTQCNSATIDMVCDLYSKSPKPIGAATANLKRDDSTNTISDKIVGFSDWALKSTGIDNYKSSGIVSDLLYGYDNLIKQKASPVVIQGMSAMDGVTIKGINAHLGELGLAIIGGALVATGIKGANVSKKLMGKTATSLTRLASRKSSSVGVKALFGKLGTKLLGSVSSGLGIAKLLSKSIGWIGLALTVYEGLSWWRDYSVDRVTQAVDEVYASGR